jgi:alpha-1,3-rhamnosyl/mannosyltransferase
MPGVEPAESDPGIGVDGDFLLFVGSLEPGKNLRLLGAMYRLASESGVELPPLVIAGVRWRGVPGEGPPSDRWRFLDAPEDAHLVWLYRRASALLFPSIYEGFGLPLLEAMSCGCPVICSRVASLPEIGGDVAIYAEPTPVAYLEAVRRLLSDPGWRHVLSEGGRARAAMFSWERCARETFAVYCRAVGARSTRG